MPKMVSMVGWERECPLNGIRLCGRGRRHCRLRTGEPSRPKTPHPRRRWSRRGPGTRHPSFTFPQPWARPLSLPPLNWRFLTTPQQKLRGRAHSDPPHGHVIGGSGSINGMVYFRGHPTDFDDWAAAGNSGWSYREVLPYFLRSENNDAYQGSAYHGQGGPMNVTFIKHPNPMTPAFLEAMHGQGFRRNEDFNGANSEGYGPPPR